MAEQIIFYAFAACLIGGSLGVVSSRNPVYAVMFLVSCFVTSAAIWLLLEAEFLAMTLILVYVGAVMVLFLFVVMMQDIESATMRARFAANVWPGLFVGAISLVELLVVMWVRTDGFPVAASPEPHAADYSNTKELGQVLYTEYFYAFELAAFVLLLAIVAAIVLTMRDRPGLKRQDIGKQVSVRREDRVKLVSMEAETDS
jgi:NADH-quinone oxidoreductase subunit J